MTQYGLHFSRSETLSSVSVDLQCTWNMSFDRNRYHPWFTVDHLKIEANFYIAWVEGPELVGAIKHGFLLPGSEPDWYLVMNDEDMEVNNSGLTEEVCPEEILFDPETSAARHGPIMKWVYQEIERKLHALRNGS